MRIILIRGEKASLPYAILSESPNLELHLARSVQELQIQPPKPIDLIILDFGPDSRTLCSSLEALRTSYPKVPLLSIIERSVQLPQLPGVLALVRPFEPVQLLAKVEQILQAPNRVEIWGGIECTVNRVGDRFYDQCQKNGHCSRTSDILRFAELGFDKLRYPVLWETHAIDSANWKVTAKRLALLHQHSVTPIVGLVHHGSGPEHTSLLDPNFAQGVARHALEVAKRFPWIEYYTPINEPLTTARFSCLYGHWYPHLRDPLSFVRALINEVKATSAAMQAIREVNPNAKLVQTEDLGKIYSTPELAYQAEFENHRRWLSFDLLCGHVQEGHPLWGYLLYLGITKEELAPLAANPCPPDIFGINYYVTSERFLDHRLELYPKAMHGGNGRHEYVDVCAVRVSQDGIAGHSGILQEVWERYAMPIALTEVHLGCTREEQVRWLMEAWYAANKLRAQGTHIQAITAWSLLGAFDWDSLLIQEGGSYESGVFDVRGQEEPRPTALAQCIQSLRLTGDFEHPILGQEGWWRRNIRLQYPPIKPVQPIRPLPSWPQLKRSSQPLLITGARGTLGHAFQRLCELRGLPYVAATRDLLDVTDPAQIDKMLREIRPWAIVNCAGYVRVDDAETDVANCFRLNTEAPRILAEACSSHSIPLLTFSSDLVFDGSITRPYVESNRVNPLNVYGRSKAEAEKSILTAWKDSLIVRSSAFFGPWDHYNFVIQALRTLKQGQPMQAAADYYVSPTYVPDLVNACLDLLIDGERGIWHVANGGEICWADLARRCALAFDYDEKLVCPVSLKDLGLRACRPTYSVLGTERAEILPSLGDAFKRFITEVNRN